jgi:hypothetical protein
VTLAYCSRTSRYRSSSDATGSSTRARPHPAAASRSLRSASSPYLRAGPRAAIRQLHSTTGPPTIPNAISSTGTPKFGDMNPMI